MQYAVVDTETGGFSPTLNALCSVGVVILDESLNEIDRFYTLINELDHVIDPDALAVNGLTLEQIATGWPIDQVLEKLHALLADKIIICHNAAFDVGFLNARGFEITTAVDTMFLAWHAWPTGRAKLSMVCERLHIQVENAHNSLGDALLTAEALRQLITIWAVKAVHPLEPRPIDFDWFKKRRQYPNIYTS